MAKKTATEKADKADKTDKGSTSGDKGAGDKTPVENSKENEEQPVELGKQKFRAVTCKKKSGLFSRYSCLIPLLSSMFMVYNSSEVSYCFISR